MVLRGILAELDMPSYIYAAVMLSRIINDKTLAPSEGSDGFIQPSADDKSNIKSFTCFCLFLVIL